jgi:hypothetical protein
MEKEAVMTEIEIALEKNDAEWQKRLLVVIAIAVIAIA